MFDALHTHMSHAHPRRWPLALALAALLALVVILAGCGSSSGSASSGPLTVASVDGHSISLSDYQHMTTAYKLINEYSALQSNQGGGADWQSPAGRANLAQAQHQAMDTLTSLQITRDELAQRHISVSQKDISSAKQQLMASIQSAEQQTPGATFLRNIPSRAIDLLAEQSASQNALAAKVAVPTAHIRIIQLKTQAQAQALQQQAEKGADFGQLAKANSLDTNSGAQGGEIGTIYIGETGLSSQDPQFGDAFDHAVFLSTKGKYTIISDNGTYLLVEITQRADKPLSGVNNQQAQQAILSSWLTNIARPLANVQQYITIG